MTPFPRLTIRTHRPTLAAAKWLVVILVMVLAGAGAFLATSEEARLQGTGAAPEALAQARAERDALAAENRRLRARLAVIERADQVKSRAYEEVEQALAQLEAEATDLREELAFYRTVLGTPGGTGRLSIHGFSLQPTGPEGAYRFRLVLTRIGKNDTVISGSAIVRVTGARDGRKMAIGGDDPAGDAPPQAFRIRYFQRVEGRFVIPEGFEPAAVSVDVVPAGSDQPRLRRTFQWSELVG